MYQSLKTLCQWLTEFRFLLKCIFPYLWRERTGFLLILMASPWTWSTCQNKGVSGLPALINWWLKYFIVTDAECRATWSSRIRTVDSQSFLPCNPPGAVSLQSVCHQQPAAWHRGKQQQRCCSAWLLSKKKKSWWGQWLHGLSSRALACPNCFNHCRLIYFAGSVNKTAVGQYWFLLKSINALSLLN